MRLDRGAACKAVAIVARVPHEAAQRRTPGWVLTRIGSLALVLCVGSVASACGSGRPTLTSAGQTPATGASSSAKNAKLPHAVWGAPLAGTRPRGLLILIHGGGWAGFSPAALQLEVRSSLPYRRAGYETLAVDYPAGARGIEQVQRDYRLARQRVGNLPICALGMSAGGHIALMLAVKNPDLRCVVDEAGPTDLPALGREPGGAIAYRLALRTLGQSNLAALSPALHAASIKAKLLLVYAQTDPLVPLAQGKEMARADPSARLIVLPPGLAPFVHTGIDAPASTTGVSPSAKDNAILAEARFLEASTAQ